VTSIPDPVARWAWLRASSDVAWRLLVVLAAVLALGLVHARLQLVVLPVFIGLLVACILAPPARWLERRRVLPRSPPGSCSWSP
jgi:predicted PurR-regulated permease PerM